MTHSEKIITLARRNCIDNILYWTNYYETTRGKNLTYDFNIFPRYQTAEAILKDIETLVGKDFQTLDDCYKEIKFFGLNSQSHFTTGKLNDLQKRAINDARQKFITFIDNISNEQIDKVEPLPFRRRLLENEANSVRKEIGRAHV